MTEHARMATRPGDLERFGLTNHIEQWEDGLRTDPAEPGQYEWWYFDAHLDNGAKLVASFHTKDATAPGTGLAPRVQVDLDLPDGRAFNLNLPFDPLTFAASTEGCDVRIGDNTFSGDLHEYTIRASVQNVSLEARLIGQTEPWRPAAGHIVYGEDEQQYFAWLPSVPYGDVEVSYQVADEPAVTATGNGYHDHNWGNAPLASIIDNWYWGRGAVGPCTFITAHIVSDKKYSYDPITVFMLAKDGKVIADNQELVTFAKSGIHNDPSTGKPVGDVHSYTLVGEPGQDSYEVSYHREATILAARFVDQLGGLKRLAARLVGFDGAYLRFSGPVTVTWHRPGEAGQEVVSGPAIWELMYPGKTRAIDRP